VSLVGSWPAEVHPFVEHSIRSEPCFRAGEERSEIIRGSCFLQFGDAIRAVDAMPTRCPEAIGRLRFAPHCASATAMSFMPKIRNHRLDVGMLGEKNRPRRPGGGDIAGLCAGLEDLFLRENSAARSDSSPRLRSVASCAVSSSSKLTTQTAVHEPYIWLMPFHTESLGRHDSDHFAPTYSKGENGKQQVIGRASAPTNDLDGR